MSHQLLQTKRHYLRILGGTAKPPMWEPLSEVRKTGYGFSLLTLVLSVRLWLTGEEDTRLRSAL